MDLNLAIINPSRLGNPPISPSDTRAQPVASNAMRSLFAGVPPDRIAAKAWKANRMQGPANDRPAFVTAGGVVVVAARVLERRP